MRTALIAAGAAALAATPAAAQDRALERAAERLSDPVVQEGVAGMVAALAGIVLDTPVGPLARYSDGRVRPSDTLRDVKRREDPAFEARLRDDTRRAVGTAGAVAGDTAAMVGALAVTAARLQAAIAPLAAYAGRAADPRDDDPDGY